MGAPKGNKNAIKGKPWSDALRRALAREAGSVDAGLDKIASAVVREAIVENEATARREIWERLEGKVADRVDLGNADGLPFRTEHEIPDAELAAIATGRSSRTA